MTEYISLEHHIQYLREGDVIHYRPVYSMYRPTIESTLKVLERTGSNLIQARSRQRLIARVIGDPVMEGEGVLFFPYVPVVLLMGVFDDHVRIEPGGKVHAYNYEIFTTEGTDLMRNIEQRGLEDLFGGGR